MGGNPNPYTYPTDPINNSDLTGQCGWKFWTRCKKPSTPTYRDRYGNNIPVQANAAAKAAAHGLGSSQLKKAFATAYRNIDPNADGTTWIYTTYASRYQNGRQVAEVEIRMVVNFRPYGNSQFGLVTAYCVGSQHCPGWV